MPGSNPKRKPKLTVKEAKLGKVHRVGKRSGTIRPLSPGKRIERLEGRVCELEAALRTLLESTATSAHQAQRYSPVQMNGEPLSLTILRDRGSY
jgi:hypothetical protein